MNYQYPPQLARTQHYLVVVNGVPQTVISADSADICIFSGEGPFEVEVSLFVRREASRMRISPAHQLTYAADSWKLQCRIPRPVPGLMVAGDDMRPLFLFPCPPEPPQPNPEDPLVQFFRAGTIHEAGEITIPSGGSVYIEGGAVVRGCIRATEAENVSILGRGILDGRFAPWEKEEVYRQAMIFDRCRDIRVEGITSIHPRLMTTVIGGSSHAKVTGLHALGEMLSTDGVDIIGSTDVVVEDSFFAINDDCIALKSANWSYTPADGIGEWRMNVERVHVHGCTVLNRGSSAAFEIGHETSCDEIAQVVFENCDVLAKHGHGAVFGLHNFGRSRIHDITFRAIRIEHHFDKLFDLRIEPSIFSDGNPEDLGSMDNILFEDLDIARKPINAGYTVSLIGGHSPSAEIRDVRFRNIRINGQPIKHLDELPLHTRHAHGVRLLDPLDIDAPASLLMNDLPSPELKKWIARGWDTLLVPLASTEQHGPALPLDVDVIHGRETCLRAARLLGKTLVGPDVPFGYAPQHASFPGSISLRQETLRLLIEDIAASAALSGFRFVYLWIAHAENDPVLREVLPGLRDRFPGCRIEGLRSLADYAAATWDIMAEAEGISAEVGGSHAGEIETSMMLAVVPERVRMDLTEAGNPAPFSTLVEKMMSEGMASVSPNGVLGDQRPADSLRGRHYLDRLARYLADDIAALRLKDIHV